MFDFLAVLLFLVCVAWFFFGVWSLLKARKTRRPIRPALTSLIGAPLFFLVAAGILGSTMGPTEAVSKPPSKTKAAEPKAAETPAPKPAPEPTPPVEVVTPPAPEPVVEEPAPEAPVTPEAVTPPVNRSDLQNLAIIADRSETDQELTTLYAKLTALCPPEGPTVGDMVVNLQGIVKRESGREMDIVDVMRQLATAQEGGAEVGMKCSETGGALASLLINGM